jgi:tetratricopeptide (TPR) repeat protein
MKSLSSIVFFICFICLGIVNSGIGQDSDKWLIHISRLSERSRTDSQKVDALGKLANYYYTFKLNDKGDSVLRQQLLLAELSNNPNLITQTLFSNAIQKLSPNASKESFENTIKFIDRGIRYAQANDQYKYLTLGFIRKSELYRKRGDLEQALYNCFQGLMQVNNVQSDSIKAILYIELGKVYLAQNEALLACTNFNTAYRIALHAGSVPLQSDVYHSLSEMYKQLGDHESAKKELMKSLELNKKAGDKDGLMDDYYDIARLTDEKFYIEKTIHLADSISSFYHILNGKRLMLAYYYVVEKDARKALNYLASESVLRQSYINDGAGNYPLTIGNIYFYSGHKDSALVYYSAAIPQIQEESNQGLLSIAYGQIGQCYQQLGNEQMAINYFEKALRISMARNNINSIADYSYHLSQMYSKQGQYKSALDFLSQAENYKDSIRELSRQNEIALLGVDRENMKHHQEMMQEKQHEINKANIQYAGIVILILIAFFFMIIIGSFTVSPFIIRLMGYFFFISLFEFFILLIDNLVLHASLKHEPLKLWMMKIVIIAMLVPCQHFMEHHVIRLLSSRRLFDIRKALSIKKWISSKKPQIQEEIAPEEEEVGIL